MFDVSDLATFQSGFLDSITGRVVPSSRRLRVYHDTWFYGLLEGLREVYPVMVEALGNEAFNAFARDFIHAHPLSSGDRNTHGADLPDFLATHPELPVAWLPDLARFEWAHHAAHHAADATPCTFEYLLDPAARIVLHPSLYILDMGHDIKGLYAALSQGLPPPIVLPITCQSLIGRDREDAVVQLCLARLERDCLNLIRQSGSLLVALDQLAPTADDMTLLQTLLAGLVRHGLIVHPF